MSPVQTLTQIGTDQFSRYDSQLTTSISSGEDEMGGLPVREDVPGGPLLFNRSSLCRLSLNNQ